MYTLLLFLAGSSAPAQSHAVKTSTEVLRRIPELLAAHDRCERVVVLGFNVRLFSVDANGNQEP